ncbi:MAG: sigma 54-interacting transcriptional regulator [Phycisphaerae bacterium]
MRPFRMLWVDDQLAEGLRLPLQPPTTLQPQQAATVLYQLMRHVRALGKSARPIEVYVSADLLLQPHTSVRAVYPENASWETGFWRDLDILILDIGGLTLADRDRLLADDVAGLTADEALRLNAENPGAAFYLKNRKQLRACQAVIILTVFDAAHSSQDQAQRALVEKYLDPCCCAEPGEDGPHTMKHPRNQSGFERVADVVESLYSDYCDGYTLLTNREQIEYGATLDLPVVLVGETGTGKEYIANAIHRRWVQQQRRCGRQPQPRREIQVVNCAGLSEELARSELFGHVRGSFTTADDHKLGVILEACGCSRITTGSTKYPPPGGWAAHYETEMRRVNGRFLEQNTLRFSTTGAMGTVFLDEFGELPLSIQTLLLRYLQTWELQPVGYPGRVERARTRVIVATSDPRIGEFYGAPLPDSWRSREEQDRAHRDDLLHRLKGLVIRTEPVTPKNIRAKFTDLLNRRHGPHPPPWDDHAIDAVCDMVSQRLQRAESIARFAFGHLRELSRIIDLADAYLEHAGVRGLRGLGDRVTDDIVKRVWRPSMVAAISAPQAQAVDAGPSGVETSSGKEAELTLANLEARLAQVVVNWHDEALRGARIRLEASVERILRRVAGAAIKRYSELSDDFRAKVARLLDDDESLKSADGGRMLNKIAGKNQNNTVDASVIESLLSAWRVGPGGEATETKQCADQDRAQM